MTDRLPITRATLLDSLNNDEVIEGYMDGRSGCPEPGNNRSFSYWHGWCNGLADSQHGCPTPAQRELARDVIATGYLHN